MDQTEQAQNPDVANQAVEHHEKTPQESFAELRKAKDDMERQLWEAKKERELLEKHYQMQQQQQRQPAAPQEEDYDFRELNDQEFPDGKALSKAFSTVNRKLSAYENKLAEKDQKIQILEALNDPSMPDYKSVVTAENIEKYIKNDEDNRESVERASNPLRKVYNLIVKDARYQAEKADKASKSKPSQEQQRVDERQGKPQTGSLGVRSAAVTQAAQLSNSKMSKDQKNALWAETLAASRR